MVLAVMECVLLLSYPIGVSKVVEGSIGVMKDDEIRDLRERFSCK